MAEERLNAKGPKFLNSEMIALEYHSAKCTVKLQWLEQLWDHGNSFETWVGLIMAPVKEANSINLGKSFRFSTE